MSDVVTPVVDAAPVVVAPVAPVVAAAAPVKPSAAAAVLESIRAKRAEKTAAKAPGQPAVAPIPVELQAAANRWKAHESSERSRIKTAAADLDDDDRKLVESEPDIGRQAALLARFKRTAEAPAVKAVAKPKPAGGPPSASSIDFAAAIKDPTALADAKARDPAGFTKFFSDLLKGSSRKSSLG